MTPTANVDPKAPLTVALPKGRLAEQTADLLTRAGYDMSALGQKSRKLIRDCGELRLLLIRAADVPTYVDHGAADMGVTGSDVLDEEGRDLYEPLDLGLGKCRMVVCEPRDRPVDVRAPIHLRIATKYPNITRRHLHLRGITAEVIKLSGSVELGALIGLADQIVDVVETGKTLAENGLVEVETIQHISARLVVNPARLKLRSAKVSRLIERLAEQV